MIICDLNLDVLINDKMRIYVPDNETERTFRVKNSNGEYHIFITFDVEKYRDKEIIESKIEVVNKDETRT